MPEIQENRMHHKKESLEISCPECDSRFRLWVPSDMLSEWENGARINCIKCGAGLTVRKDNGGFSVSLEAPARREEKAPVQAAPERKQPRAEEHREAAPAQTGESVLLIEDDRLARAMVENTLKDTGVRLFMAKNAVEALKLIRKEKIKLIVTDLYLKNPADPESLIDGEELLKRVADSGMNIPAIITTGKDIIDDLVLDPKWFDLHVKGFIQKGNPFWAEELKVKLKEVMYRD